MNLVLIILFQVIIYQTRLLINLFIYWFILSIFMYTLTSNVSIYDLILRIILSDSIINHFNFFWTSTTYLIPLSLLLLYIIFQFYLNLFNIYLSLLVLLMFLYSLETSDILIFNYNTPNSNYSNPDFNALLSNNLNKYHPYFLYSSAFFIVLSSGTYLLFTDLGLRFFTLFYLNSYYSYNNRSLFWSLFALFLGCWWALQEGTWGGWWNWDTSEVLGLTVLIFSILNLHSYISSYNHSTLKLKGYLITLYITNFFFMLQLNFEITSHSFGSRLSYFFNSNLLMLNSSIIIFLSILIIHSYSLKILTNLNLILTKDLNLLKSFNFYLLWLYLGLLIAIILNTILPLFNYYVWKFFELNYFNLIIDLNLLVLYLVISLTLILNYHTYYYYYLLLLLILIPKSPLIFALFLVLPYQFSSFYMLHLLALSLFHSNYFFITFDLITLNYSSDYLLTSNTEYSPYSNLNTNSCSNYFVVNTTNSYSNLVFKYKSYNFFNNTNSLSLNTFNLIFDTQSVINMYQNLNLLYLKGLNFELTSLDLLFNLFIFFLLILTYLYTITYKLHQFTT